MSRSGTRVLALDLGAATIGLALSDPLGITAQPIEPLRCVGPRKDINRLAEIIEEREVGKVVIGLPLLLSGDEGTAAQQSREFADRLSRRLPGLDVEFWDERLTTVEAERLLVSADVRRKKRKRVVDTLAAVLILQGYLDANDASSLTTP